MWVGRHDNQQFGGVAGHLYVEFDGGPTDPDRLRAAATRLSLRHPMLRVRFLPDGMQRIAPADECGDFPVAVEDLRQLDADLAAARLDAIRETKSHQQLDGAVFELALTLLPGERSRLHVDLDMQAADAMSYRTLMSDLAALYLGRELPELGCSYREYRQAIVRGAPRPAPSRLAMPTAIGGRSASRSCPTRRCRRRFQAGTRTGARVVGTGSTRRPATPCSPAPGRGASPRRWRWPGRSPTPWPAGRPRHGFC
jgi:mycobactin phenyloxazoline synthetase